MDRMLDQEMLTFTPRAGSFDVERLASGLSGIGFPFRDEVHPERFLICATEKARAYFQAARRAAPSSPYPRVVNVDIRADRVNVWPASYHPALREVSRQVLEWLAADRDCDVVNEDDVDMTRLPA